MSRYHLLFLVLFLSIQHTKCYHLSTNKNILLIINYSSAYYESIPFLKLIYKNFFPKIIFYGPEKDGHVNFQEDYKGWFSYQSIAHAIQHYSGYKGYLWIHDDVVINPWNLRRLNETKIWFSKAGFENHQFSGIANLSLGLNDNNWWVWPYPCGYQATLKTYKELAKENLEILKNNLGENKIAYGYADIIYVPGRLAKKFCDLCMLFAKNKVFLEIALPTICASLVARDEIDIFNGVQLWWDGKRETPEKFYDYSIDYIHPFKFSDKKNRIYIKEKFTEKLSMHNQNCY